MKQLLLLRHAKSGWTRPNLHDFDRNLDDAGQVQAQKMAVCLAQSFPLPDHIICSTAQRTRETLTFVLGAYQHPLTIDLSRHIYEAPYGVILEKLQAVEAEVETVLVVGHNPGMEDVVFSLVGDGHDAAFEALGGQYPTGGCAHLVFNVENWSDLTRGRGFFQKFSSPKTLE